MAAAAHNPGGYGGVPQTVGKEFNDADQAKKQKYKRKSSKELASKMYK